MLYNIIDNTTKEYIELDSSIGADLKELTTWIKGNLINPDKFTILELNPDIKIIWIDGLGLTIILPNERLHFDYQLVGEDFWTEIQKYGERYDLNIWLDEDTNLMRCTKYEVVNGETNTTPEIFVNIPVIQY